MEIEYKFKNKDNISIEQLTEYLKNKYFNCAFVETVDMEAKYLTDNLNLFAKQKITLRYRMENSTCYFNIKIKQKQDESLYKRLELEFILNGKQINKLFGKNKVQVVDIKSIISEFKNNLEPSSSNKDEREIIITKINHLLNQVEARKGYFYIKSKNRFTRKRFLTTDSNGDIKIEVACDSGILGESVKFSEIEFEIKKDQNNNSLLFMKDLIDEFNLEAETLTKFERGQI